MVYHHVSKIHLALHQIHWLFIASRFNNYFSNIADDILNGRKYDGNKNFKCTLPNAQPDSLFSIPVDTNENIILSLYSKTENRRIHQASRLI